MTRPGIRSRPPGPDGYVIRSHSEAVAELIERFLALDEDARMRMRTAARDLARQVLNDPRGVDANRAMFHALTSSRSS